MIRVTSRRFSLAHPPHPARAPRSAHRPGSSRPRRSQRCARHRRCSPRGQQLQPADPARPGRDRDLQLHQLGDQLDRHDHVRAAGHHGRDRPGQPREGRRERPGDPGRRREVGERRPRSARSRPAASASPTRRRPSRSPTRRRSPSTTASRSSAPATSTSTFYSTSRDYGVFDTDAADVAAVVAVFNADFAKTSITPSDGDDLVWSPTDSQTQLLALINGAQHTLDVEQEEFSDTALVNADRRGREARRHGTRRRREPVVLHDRAQRGHRRRRQGDRLLRSRTASTSTPRRSSPTTARRPPRSSSGRRTSRPTR